MRSEAQKKADKKYNSKRTTVHLGISIKPEDYNFIDNYSKDNNISKAQLIIKAVRYCIEHDIKLQ